MASSVKMGGIYGGGLLTGLDGVAPTRVVVCLPLVILLSTIKSTKSFLLAPAHPGGPGKSALKWWWCGTSQSAMKAHNSLLHNCILQHICLT